ncbi:efflux RND transporter periplasmic adaptor subunit [Methylomonas sp. SURF-2]|uniref:Efflux RND transporter periplasmic adaptor subunit n=1 Tax=Methylomonas subterranea TaxID=2952225 RepID=A0ABT1TK04_9GAMM|nr:efflux RND transporter periplasmic adaptor subunit [Methylomonas sp. SURF-2]MCQ8105800.1 efflux RND transporter periplasmic adaptor subunit [Methylomonas sp. SURF-2]
MIHLSNSSMTTKGRLLAGFLLPLTIVVGCSVQDKPAQVVARPVKVFRIEQNAVAGARSFAGEVRARIETPLSFRVAGKLLERKVDVGDSVRKGQLLAILDGNDYRLAVQGLKAQLASAQADSTFLRDDLARYRELLTQQVISPPEFERHETAYTTARERTAALEAQLAQALNQLTYTELHADRNGVVTALAVEAGQVLAAGQAVVTLAQLDEKEIHFDVPEHRLPEIKRQQEVSVSLWSDDKRRLKARIREIASAAEPASRTYRVKATVLEGLDAALLGMTATVHIDANTASGIAIPLSAVYTPQNQPDHPLVWLIDEQAATVKSVPVKLGETLAGERIAVEGVAPGQLLVSAGVQRLAEGQAVRLPAENAPAKEGSL